MRYTTIVDKDERGLIQIIEAAKKFEEDRFLEGIRQRCYTAADVQTAIDRVREYQSRLTSEARALVYFSETFLQQYATDNNRCFETAQLLFNRIRSTLKASRAVFRKTCPTRRRVQPAVCERPSIYLRSVLSGGECNRDLFGIQSYEDSVQTLYMEMKTFFTTVITTLGLCHYMIRTERAIREDGDRCEQIYKECEARALGSIREVTRVLESVKTLPENELNERKARARSSKDFYRENYHQWDTGQFRMSVALDVLRKGRNDGLTDEETRLWPDDHQHALRVKEVIGRIDTLPGIEGNPNKLKGSFVVELIKWAAVGSQDREKAFYDYFCRQYRAQGGRYETPSWNAISTERKNRRDMGISDDEQVRSFEQRLTA
jgi:hypothetical protein